MSKQSFDGGLYGRTISEWVLLVHTKLSKNYDMKKQIELEHGDFGFDAYASVLVSILHQVSPADIMKSIQGSLDKSRFIESAHAAWIDNYVFWKNSVSSDVATAQRNERATTSVANLERYDKALYDDMITEVFSALAQQVLEAGMQQLTM